MEYNIAHNITPKTIKKEIKSIADQLRTQHDETVETLLSVDMDLYRKNPQKTLKEKKKQMEAAVAILDFETAAILRDELRYFEEQTIKDAKAKK